MTILLYIFAAVGALTTAAAGYIAGAYWCWSQGQKNRGQAELDRSGLWDSGKKP